MKNPCPLRDKFRRMYSLFRYYRKERRNWGEPHCFTATTDLFRYAADNIGGMSESEVERIVASCIKPSPKSNWEHLADWLWDHVSSRLESCGNQV